MTDPTAFDRADATCDGGDLDCGSGLLLIIRNAFQPVPPGGTLLVKSRETSVREDLPAWCRLVGHAIEAERDADGGYRHFLLRKKGHDAGLAEDLKKARAHVWQARARWTGGMQAKATMRNHAVAVGQPASFDTEDAAPSAVELLLAAVAGALTTGFQWRLSQRGVEVHNLEVVAKARSADALVFLGVASDGNPGFAEVDVAAYVSASGDADFEAEWRETVRRCPVTQSLLRSAPVRTTLRAL